MRILGIDVVAYLVAHGAAVNEHNHGSGNILNGFFCNPDRHIVLSDNVFMEGFMSKRQSAAVDALEEAAFSRLIKSLRTVSSVTFICLARAMVLAAPCSASVFRMNSLRWDAKYI